MRETPTNERAGEGMVLATKYSRMVIGSENTLSRHIRFAIFIRVLVAASLIILVVVRQNSNDDETSLCVSIDSDGRVCNSECVQSSLVN